MKPPKFSLSTTKPLTIIKFLIFSLLLLLLTISAVFFTFRGLSSPRAMEQAQIGREIARGNGYTTKMIRPVSIWQNQQASKERADSKLVDFQNFPETYHAPLNPFIYAGVILASQGYDSDKWRMPTKNYVWELDRLIAATCVIFFLISIGVNYLLISRIFDAKIASVTACLMMLCSLMWEFSQSGLPQMLMLMLFSFAMFFLWIAMENKNKSRPFFLPVILSGVFLCLLVLSKWLNIWIFLAFLIIATYHFRPRNLIATSLLFTFGVLVLPALYFLYYVPTNTFAGVAYYSIHSGIGSSEDSVLRSMSEAAEELGVTHLFSNLLLSTFSQLADLYRNLGSIAVAPLFLLALIHPFKRKEISDFRLYLFIMWIFASFGMGIFGIRGGSASPGQIHILFAPIMTAYGLAFLSILWSRVKLPHGFELLKNAHIYLVMLISAAPILLNLYRDIEYGIRWQDIGGRPHWPPYLPSIYNRTVAYNTTEKDVIISDIPWATSWYGDRLSVWLPSDIEQIEQIEQIARERNTPVHGILISPYSFNGDKIIKTSLPEGLAKGTYADLFPLVFNGFYTQIGARQPFIMSHPDFRSLAERYPSQEKLMSYNHIMYYSKKPLLPAAY